MPRMSLRLRAVALAAVTAAALGSTIEGVRPSVHSHSVAAGALASATAAPDNGTDWQ